MRVHAHVTSTATFITAQGSSGARKQRKYPFEMQKAQRLPSGACSRPMHSRSPRVVPSSVKPGTRRRPVTGSRAMTPESVAVHRTPSASTYRSCATSLGSASRSAGSLT